MHFLDILVVFRLDLSQISFHPVENAFATQQLALLANWHSVLGHFDSGMHRNQNFETSLGFSIFGILFAFLFSPFLFFWLQWLTFYWACLRLKKTSKKASSRRAIFIMEQPGVVAGNFAEFFIQFFLAFLCISQAPFGQSLWSGHHWKDLFLLQKLSVDDTNFGQKWWCQKWKSPRFITAGYGRQWSLFLFHFLESDQKNLKTCLTLAPHSPRNNMKSALGQVNRMVRAFPGNMSIKFSGTLLYTQVERGTDMVCETQCHSPPLSLDLKM